MRELVWQKLGELSYLHIAILTRDRPRDLVTRGSTQITIAPSEAEVGVRKSAHRVTLGPL